MKKYIAAFAIIILAASSGVYAEEGYELLHTGGGLLFNLGPTGLWGYGPARNSTYEDDNHFVVDRAEVGSPAHGLVREHDMITGVNGKPFTTGADPRHEFAFAIEDSEAEDGKLRLDITRGGMPIKKKKVVKTGADDFANSF